MHRPGSAPCSMAMPQVLATQENSHVGNSGSASSAANAFRTKSRSAAVRDWKMPSTNS